MNNVKIENLPGIGKKITMKLMDGLAIIIISDSQERFITLKDKECKELTIKLSNEDYRTFCAMLIAGDMF
jgi:K+/H+ antiporter YhaU regulatory subunit KhtT